ncbi:hypothetical protein JDT15_29065 [Salmonella enterica subsp. enterica serovar Infantis]|nr:hypothetical protein [Salmonella enterica subsp. enterica serovar Infantis]
MSENTTTSCVRGPLRARPFRKVRLFLQSVLPLTNGQLVHDLSYALDAADISDARAQRNVSFICITFQHADTQPA